MTSKILFLEPENTNTVMFTKYENEIIYLNFLKDYKNINLIKIKFKVSKSNISNKFCIKN